MCITDPNCKKILRGILSFLLLCLTSCATAQQLTFIQPGEPWPDNNGIHINAHGGGILQFKGLYYWYGEQRNKVTDPEWRYINCYTSKDLINWNYQGAVFKTKSPDTALHNWVLERPKVYFNRKTRKFVMYVHVDGEVSGIKGDYNYAKVGIATSDYATGPFTYIKCIRPLGCVSRDIGQFVDDDGKAYLIFEDRIAKGFHIALLSPDYLDVIKDVCLIKSPLEGGAVVRYKGLYYVIGSALTGWTPNPNKYATAKRLSGPWSDFKDIAPPESNTYASQSTFLLKVIGTKKTSVIFMADQWKRRSLWDSRYLWMPLEIGAGQLVLPQPQPWTINIKTGETSLSTANH
jgi:hypothetical protein